MPPELQACFARFVKVDADTLTVHGIHPSWQANDAAWPGPIAAARRAVEPPLFVSQGCVVHPIHAIRRLCRSEGIVDSMLHFLYIPYSSGRQVQPGIKKQPFNRRAGLLVMPFRLTVFNRRVVRRRFS